MQPNPIAERVAANVRAELARQRKTQRQLREVLGIKQTAMARRLSGEVPFDVNELAVVAEFLALPLQQLMPAPALATPA